MITEQYEIFRAEPDMSVAGFKQVLIDAGSPFAPDAEYVYRTIWGYKQSHAFWLAICGEEHTHGTNENSVLWRSETLSWGNSRSLRYLPAQFSARQISDPVRGFPYVQYDYLIDSVHDCCYRVAEPAYVYASEGRRSVGKVIERFAPAGENNSAAYKAGALKRMNEYVNSYPYVKDAPLTPTGDMIQWLRSKGREVWDQRGLLPANSNPGLRYKLIELPKVDHIICHWTGDNFGEFTIDTIVGHPVPGADITAALTQADEKKLLDWWANYHLTKDGGSWGGIAYGTLIFPSGRIHVAHDIGTATYHAYAGANFRSYAVCCPNANSAQPTDAALRSLGFVLEYLVDRCAVINVDRSRVLGHLEAKVLDSQNQTSCPGTYLPFVKDFRAGSSEPDPAPANPPYFFAATKHRLYGGFKDYWVSRGEIPGDGFPTSEEVDIDWPDAPGLAGHVTPGSRRVQWFERARYEWWPENQPPYQIQRSLLGVDGSDDLRDTDALNHPQAFAPARSQNGDRVI